MQTLEELEARHQQELTKFLADQEKRDKQFADNQQELLAGLTWNSPKVHDMLKETLQEQRQSWETKEQDELDMLKHIQSLERQYFLDKQFVKGKLADQIISDSPKEKNRERS